jgi:DNA helicase-2/ATP-dependent DNA helicase PcrA
LSNIAPVARLEAGAAVPHSILMESLFKILLHHRLLSHWRRKPGVLTADVQKTLERLQLGYWDNGTRVKILKGVRKAVYEARVTRSVRMLFTVARAPSTEPPHDMETCLMVWDLVVHDDIDRARRMNTEPEAGFLDFTELAAFAIDQPPVAAHADLPDRDLKGDEARRLLEQSDTGMYTTPPEFVEAIRWYELDPEIVIDDAEWQALIDDPTVTDLELKLSVEQAETVFAPGPVLLCGTAGSGKTTVSVYRLANLAAEARDARILYVTYSPALLATVEQLFRDLHRSRRWPLPDLMPEFRTFPDLYAEMSGDRMKPERLLRYPAFENWYRSLYRRDDAALVWEEIRGIIKGACLDPSSGHLSFAAYEELGRKRAPLYIAERQRLYRAFEQYQGWARADKRHDDIDLARRALAAILRNPQNRYDYIICDEGQDLTELEQHLLVTACRDVRGLFLAADPQQIVNPSGFRWADLRTLMRRDTGTVPEIRTLLRNFRSVQSIVSLANAFVQIQCARTGRSSDDILQETTLTGATPVLVSGDEADVLARIQAFGPRCAVIAPTEEIAAELRERLGTERVFDVAGSKGLEFDACVLWRVLGENTEIWERLLLSEENVKENPVCRRTLRHVYVAVTRARRYLGVYEAEDAVRLWQTPWLRSQIELDAPEALQKFMLAAASPDEWHQEGKYFQRRGRYRQAAECYRHAGDEMAAVECDALFHRSVDNFSEAADLFERAGKLGDAAGCREQLGEHERAGPLYAAAEAWSDAARNYDAADELEAAAEAYRLAEDIPNYRRCQMLYNVRDGNWVEAARAALKLGDRTAAIDYYNRAGLPDRAREIMNSD